MPIEGKKKEEKDNIKMNFEKSKNEKIDENKNKMKKILFATDELLEISNQDFKQKNKK